MDACPNCLLTPDVLAMLDAYRHYRNGFLPVAGGMSDQAAVFGDAVCLLAGMWGHEEEREMKNG